MMTDYTPPTEEEIKAAEEAHALSSQNRSNPDPATRETWQSANISTDGNGPKVEDVSPVFAQARADALAHPVTADSDDETLTTDPSSEAADAQARADALRDSPGYVAPTGADAGIYDDDKLKDSLPEENFNAAPELAEDERSADEVAKSENLQASQAGIGQTDTTEVDQRVPEANTEANPPVSTPEAPTSNPAEPVTPAKLTPVQKKSQAVKPEDAQTTE